MKESIGTTWIFQMVIIFILIFVSFLIVTLTYSKTFKTRNELINIIEKYEGVTEESLSIMNQYLRYNSYQAMKKCPANWYGVASIEKIEIEKVGNGSVRKYYYCLKRNVSKKSSLVHYDIKVFFKFNLPIFETIGTFTVNGSTSDFYKTDDILSKGI